MEGNRTVHGRRGLLAVNKPKEISSYDVIRQLKKILGQSKIGHAGTLDPFASGVLVILIGAATKINQFLDPFDKEYEFEIVLGIETDTLDRTGRITQTATVPALTAGAVESALGRFIGRQTQIPPRFSAVYIDGTRAYKLAAQGIEFEPEPRTVEVYRFELVKFDSPIVTLKAVVSKGTYIRALARDLGAALGVGATVRELTRTRIGPIALADAVAVDGLSDETIDERLVGINSALAYMPLVTIRPEAKARFLKGQSVGIEETVEFESAPKGADSSEDFIRVVDGDDAMLVIARPRSDRLKPYRVIYADT